MSGQTLQDGVGNNHGLECLLAIDVRLTVVLNAIDEFGQFLHKGVGAGGVHWQSLDGAQDRMAINARLVDGLDWTNLRVRQFDGADTWKYLDA